jgi:hypothetical protein
MAEELIKRTRAKKTDRHYVDNKLFFTVMLQYRTEYDIAKATHAELPKIPKYVGECLYKIATRLSMKPNFINYTFRDEMISDGLENCITYLHNFDPEKSQNPFAYFTQIIYYAFLRRIENEKKHLYIKQKTLENFYFEGMLAEQSGGEDDRVVSVNLDNEYMQGLVVAYDKKRAENQQKAKDKKNQVGLEKFYDDEREQDTLDPASNP